MHKKKKKKTMENGMNKNQLLNALAAAEIEVPVRPTVVQLRGLFAENRQQVEAILVDQEVNQNENGEESDDDGVADENVNEQNDNENVRAPEAANGNRNVRNEANHGQLNEIPQRNQGEYDEIERELANLRRQHEILRLRREIELMQRGEFMNENRAPIQNAAPVVPAPNTTRKIHFHDIEHAIVKFNGEDRTYSVNDF